MSTSAPRLSPTRIAAANASPFDRAGRKGDEPERREHEERHRDARSEEPVHQMTDQHARRASP